ncbi:hypothetical protein PybrP1_000784 [[Pythium] brassicae (nom. inval.)]|nr:hypothetical protein PybrP1_000784 [[Pythium] brassicae (nom. inval.)]
MAVNKLELLVLSALFLSPCAVIIAKCAEAPSLFALHPAANALAFLVFFPASVYAMLVRKATETNNKPHFTSTHSWLAGATVTLFTLNLLGGLGTTFAGKKTSWQWKNPGHRIGGMLTFVLGGTTTAYGVYSGTWGKTILGADKQFKVVALVGAAYSLLVLKAVVTKAATVPAQKKRD